MSEPETHPTPDTEAAAPPSQDAVLEALKAVKDPEIGVNIVDLGLVYTVSLTGSEVEVEMTLTSPACPAGPQILREADAAIRKLEGVSGANVRLVMSPPWSPDRMSDEARDELGMF